MQADFTDQPEHIPELVKRFEGGADIVAAKQEMSEAPAAVRRLRRFADWIQRAGLPNPGGAVLRFINWNRKPAVLREGPGRQGPGRPLSRRAGAMGQRQAPLGLRPRA